MIITGKKFSKPEMSRVINGDVVLNSEEEKPEKFRLDLLLVEKFPEYNRSSLQTFIKSGFVKVDGVVAKKPNEKYEKTAVLELAVPEKAELKAADEPTVLFEDENVKVFDKPAGLLSMAKGEYCPEPTLEDFGLLVHRLDRDTSGVVILAKNPEVQSFLRRQFQDRKTHKTYIAVVEGRPKLDEAKIDLPIARNLKHPTTFQVDPNGKPSVTFYRVLKTNEKYSLLELKPVTGRTHQLRVHLKYLGTPILGDPVYGNSPEKQRSDYERSAEQISEKTSRKTRLFLHAKSLEITIPGENGGKRKVFESPLPKEFEEIFEA
ncbi:RluA family pseudouridine synthase [Candidatus Saccharibacteria bacterium]|nr:RluA family pseudouridine synthase [Candidatus Saccharibacteria bacterium]